jgi:hypothetical protein
MTITLSRRKLIAIIAGAAAWPIVARAQQPTIPVIGFLHQASPDTYPYAMSAFLQGLNEAGYVEGRNVAVEYRWAEEHYDRLPMLAADLVQRKVAIIFASLLSAALAAKSASATISIVFVRRYRSSRDWAGHRIEPTGWPCHRRERARKSARDEAVGAATRTRSNGRLDSRAS